MMTFLKNRSSRLDLSSEFSRSLTNQAIVADTRAYLMQKVQKGMKDVTSGDFVAKIKQLMEEAVCARLLEGISKEIVGLVRERRGR